MISVDGYKAFRGTMKINALTAVADGFVKNSFTKHGDWLYKPECKCWYSGMYSYPECICEILEDETKTGE